MAHVRRKRRLAPQKGKRDTRRTARAGEAHQPRGRRSRKRRDRADGRGGEAQGTREVFRPVPCARIGARMRGLTPREGSLAERGGADVPPTRLVQPREMPGSKADGARMAVQPRRTRRRRQSLDCRARRGQGGCAASRGPQRRPAFPADSPAQGTGNGERGMGNISHKRHARLSVRLHGRVRREDDNPK